MAAFFVNLPVPYYNGTGIFTKEYGNFFENGREKAANLFRLTACVPL